MDLVKIESVEMKMVFKKAGKCLPAENVWRRSLGAKPAVDDGTSPFSQMNYLTYDVKGHGLGYSPAQDTLKILKVKELCGDYMKFMHHPAYYIKSYKRPFECESNESNLEEEKKVAKIVKDHFSGGEKTSMNKKTEGKQLKPKKQNNVMRWGG